MVRFNTEYTYWIPPRFQVQSWPLAMPETYSALSSLYLLFVRGWPAHLQAGLILTMEIMKTGCIPAEPERQLSSSAPVQFPSVTFLRLYNPKTVEPQTVSSKKTKVDMLGNWVRWSSHAIIFWIYFQLVVGCVWLPGSSPTCHIQGPRLLPPMALQSPKVSEWPASRRQ